MATMQSIVDRARKVVNDRGIVRYTDAELLVYLNAGVHRTYELRPDLKLGGYATAYADLALNAAFPLPARLEQTLVDYTVARAEMEDDEHVNSNRARQAGDLFVAELLG